MHPTQLPQVVAPTWRRRGAAAALLAAAEAAVELWDERQALLHVYQDNVAAVQASWLGCDGLHSTQMHVTKA